ncbi:MAG: hypothetical protein MI723_04175 [Caulobacterales bacterium]|nr:hypothetical protein [Caulobacterales bacterium]
MFRSLLTVVFGAAFGIAMLLLAMVYAPDRVSPILPTDARSPEVDGFFGGGAVDLSGLRAEDDRLRARLNAHDARITELAQRLDAAPSVAGPVEALAPPPAPAVRENSALTAVRLDRLEAALDDLEADLAEVRASAPAEAAGEVPAGDAAAFAQRLDGIEYRLQAMNNDVFGAIVSQVGWHEDRIVAIDRALEPGPDARRTPR